jgi:hypothetical protein
MTLSTQTASKISVASTTWWGEVGGGGIGKEINRKIGSELVTGKKKFQIHPRRAGHYSGVAT